MIFTFFSGTVTIVWYFLGIFLFYNYLLQSENSEKINPSNNFKFIKQSQYYVQNLRDLNLLIKKAKILTSH